MVVRMDEKRTYASVTVVNCTCNYLRNAADDPANPIAFDARTNEFQFNYRDDQDQCPATLIIYHCPFCGGAAPKSKRDQLFAAIPADEEARLANLMKPIETIDDAIDALGNPDFDGYTEHRCPEEIETPPSTEYLREIRYHGLSEVADVWITERPDGKIHWRLQGKQLPIN